MRRFVPNFLSYVSVKYSLNWFIVRKVNTKIKRVNFLWRHGVVNNSNVSYGSTAQITTFGRGACFYLTPSFSKIFANITMNHICQKVNYLN